MRALRLLLGLFSASFFGCGADSNTTGNHGPTSASASTAASTGATSTAATSGAGASSSVHSTNASASASTTTSGAGGAGGAGGKTGSGAANMVPLIDLQQGTYLGFQGGLYPGGTNVEPAAHAAVGLARALQVTPLDATGSPDPSGKVVLLSIGMSNNTMEFCSDHVITHTANTCDAWSFSGKAAADADVDRQNLVIVDGAGDQQLPPDWTDQASPDYDDVKTYRLEPHQVTEAQVQAIWFKDASSSPHVSLPSTSADAYTLEKQFSSIMRAMKQRYPNVKEVFATSRIYGGYATNDLNPEPYAYESGFSVKWMIEAQITQRASGTIDPVAGDLDDTTVSPWIAWGPYMWANGLHPRSDGLIWQMIDFDPADYTHPAHDPASHSGAEKVGGMLLDFFKGSRFTRCWFLAAHSACQ